MSSLPSSRRPIIAGYYPDPSICRVGEDFYVANSSFEFFPGVPLWHSRDLLTWEQVGHVITRTSQFEAGAYRPSMGVYAPTLRHRDGVFYLITTAVEGPEGHLLMTASDPAGPWSDPVYVQGLPGFDPDIAWTDDGTCLVTYCHIVDWVPQGIHQAAIDPSTGEVLEEPRLLWKGSGMQWPEGPHLIRRGDWWYLVIAEGGTERGHCVSIARAPRPDGPYELAPQNPILTRRSTVFPVQNTGHADMVERPDGSWAMVYLAVRARGTTPMFHVNGRETFLAGVDWQDDWPVVVPDAFSFTPDATAFADRFESGIGLRWASPGAAVADFARAVPGGGVEVSPAASDNGAPALLAARVTDLAWRFEADTQETDAAAVRLRMDESHWAELRLEEGRAVLEVRIGPASHRVVDEARVTGLVTLRVEAAPTTHHGPDDLVFTVADEAGERELDRIDGRYLSTEVAGGFLGRTIGLRTAGAPVVFDEVRYAPAAETVAGA